MKVLFATLAFMLLSVSTYANSTGEQLKFKFFCVAPSYDEAVANVLVGDGDPEDLANSFVEKNFCIFTHQSEQVTLVKEVSRVKGTKNRPDLVVWEATTPKGHTVYVLVEDDDKGV